MLNEKVINFLEYFKKYFDFWVDFVEGNNLILL